MNKKKQQQQKAEYIAYSIQRRRWLGRCKSMMYLSWSKEKKIKAAQFGEKVLLQLLLTILQLQYNKQMALQYGCTCFF